MTEADIYRICRHCALTWGPFGYLIARTALDMAEPEPRILGVIVPTPPQR